MLIFIIYFSICYLLICGIFVVLSSIDGIKYDDDNTNFLTTIIQKCMQNISDGFFNIKKFKDTYKDVIPSMFTYRSFNTYCRMNIDSIIDNTLLRYLQSDKIAFQSFIKTNGFNHSRIYYYTRERPSAKVLFDKLTDYFKNTADPLILKPSHLSFSEGITMFKNAPESVDYVSECLDSCYNTISSFTEGGTSKFYDKKIGIIVQSMVKEKKMMINEWKIMYIWGVPIIIHWKVGHTKRYKILRSDFYTLWKAPNVACHKDTNIHKDIPIFAKNILSDGEKLCKILDSPCLRVDFLWNEDEYIVNEVEIIPSNYMLPRYERLIMLLLQIPFMYQFDEYILKYLENSIKNSLRCVTYEVFANAYYIYHYLEYTIRCYQMKSIYSKRKKFDD